MLRESNEGQMTWQKIARIESSGKRSGPDQVRTWRVVDKGDSSNAQSAPGGPGMVRNLRLAIQERFTSRVAKDGDGNVIGLELIGDFKDPGTGLKVGDIIAKVDQATVLDRDEFFTALTAALAKDGVAQLTVIREESEVKLDVTDR